MFTLYAFDRMLSLPRGSSPSRVIEVLIGGHIRESATLVGRLLALSSQLAREGAAAEDPRSVISHTFAQLAVRSDDPDRRL